MKKKIAFVIQRYGLEVNGGAELHCRQLVERLQPDFEITVLSTCAIDYYSWKNEYVPGPNQVNGINILRFPVDFERDKSVFDALSQKAFADRDNLKIGEEWMKLQGPYSTALLDFIKDHQDDYEKIVFFTYLYATTYFGMPLIKDHKKIILIPTAHDEPPIYLGIFERVFKSPACIIYNTETERAFIHKRFNNQKIRSVVAGVGVEFSAGYKEQSKAFKAKHGLNQYMIYVGRIDESKGCKELFDYFLRWKSSSKSDLKLILMGKEAMTVPRHPDILSLGFVSDQDKFDGILGATFMIVPSPYESLSMSLLEAFLCQKTVLVNGACEVLKNHCLLSQGGLWYTHQAEFSEAMTYMLSHPTERATLGKNGYRYVSERYTWEAILATVKSCLAAV